jgi:DNA helicase MCM8
LGKEAMSPKVILYITLSYLCRLTPDACAAIQNFYLSLREKHRSADSTPITTRQLESLIRLSQARAKLEMRNNVTQQDALEVIEIMKESLFERLEDEFGNIDFRRTSGMSKQKESLRFISILEREVEKTLKPIFTKQVCVCNIACLTLSSNSLRLRNCIIFARQALCSLTSLTS